MTCAKCGAGDTGFFTDEGDAVCRTCFYAGQTAVQEERAEQELVEQTGGYVDPKVALRGAPAKSNVSPAWLILGGVVVMSLGGALALAGVFLMDRLYVATLFVVGIGFLVLAKGVVGTLSR